jgi:hypothetical protein
MATFDAALGPLQPYFDVVFNPGDLGEVELAELTATLMMGPAAIPVLQALAFVEVAIAAAELPPMPALDPMPAVGLGTYSGDWDVDIHGLALVTMVVAMATIPISLIIDLATGVSIEFPDIIIEMLPDVPGAATIAECITERLDPIFGG